MSKEGVIQHPQEVTTKERATPVRTIFGEAQGLIKTGAERYSSERSTETDSPKKTFGTELGLKVGSIKSEKKVRGSTTIITHRTSSGDDDWSNND